MIRSNGVNGVSYAAFQYQQYQKQSGSYLSPREIEVMALRYVNNLLEEAEKPQQRLHALAASQKLWGTLLRGLLSTDCPLEEDVRTNLVKLGTFSLRHSNAALNSNLSLQPLIDVNNNLIEGLSASRSEQAA